MIDPKLVKFAKAAGDKLPRHLDCRIFQLKKKQRLKQSVLLKLKNVNAPLLFVDWARFQSTLEQ